MVWRVSYRCLLLYLVMRSEKPSPHLLWFSWGLGKVTMRWSYGWRHVLQDIQRSERLEEVKAGSSSQQRFLERARHWSAQRTVTSVAMELE